MGASKRPGRRPRPRRRRSGAAPEQAHDPPEHLPFGLHHDVTDEPHNSLQDAFEHFFAGLGDVVGHLGRPDDDDEGG